MIIMEEQKFSLEDTSVNPDFNPWMKLEFMSKMLSFLFKTTSSNYIKNNFPDFSLKADFSKNNYSENDAINEINRFYNMKIFYEIIQDSNFINENGIEYKKLVNYIIKKDNYENYIKSLDDELGKRFNIINEKIPELIGKKYYNAISSLLNKYNVFKDKIVDYKSLVLQNSDSLMLEK
ncbi:MAG: hypothetical protein PHN56_01655 [Candidatus Nanoarchaeia archaeon]|nr:hypothetical protein [Candidatus Nanoarchaeia archaeon]